MSVRARVSRGLTCAIGGRGSGGARAGKALQDELVALVEAEGSPLDLLRHLRTKEFERS